LRLSTNKLIQNKQTSPLGRLNKLLLVSVVMLFIFEALITNAKASNGSKLVELQEQYDALQLEVTSMELEIARYASLARIKNYATEELDMKPVESNVMYMPEVIPT